MSLRAGAGDAFSAGMGPLRDVAVALIAGGRSTRMGTDKGRLKDAEGMEFWRGRLAVLRALGTEEVMISCRPDQKHFAESGARLVFDQWRDAGPMGGIVSCLEAMKAELLMVLGVDMPGITVENLRSLLPEPNSNQEAEAGWSQGAVFRSEQFFEPLAAVYGKIMAASGRERLERGQFSLQPWLRESVTRNHLRVVSGQVNNGTDFRNVNFPGDLPSGMH